MVEIGCFLVGDLEQSIFLHYAKFIIYNLN